MGITKKKGWNIAVNVVVSVIVVIVLLMAVSVIASGNKGYSSLFGVGMVGVSSGSMEGENKDSFNKYDYIFIKTVSEEQAYQLEEGQVITFRTTINGVETLNTHRIVQVLGTDPAIRVYQTKGDANNATDSTLVSPEDVVGVYTGVRLPGLGWLSVTVRTSVGFLCIVVIPSFLIVAYAVFSLIRATKQYNSERGDQIRSEATAQVTDAERERIRAELLAQMQAEAAAKPDQAAPSAQDAPKDKPNE